MIESKKNIKDFHVFPSQPTLLGKWREKLIDAINHRLVCIFIQAKENKCDTKLNCCKSFKPIKYFRINIFI